MEKSVCPEHEEEESTDFIFGETFDYYAACKSCNLRKECEKKSEEDEDVFYEHVLVNYED